MWRLRSKYKRTRVTRTELKRAIMVECGISPATYTNNRDALLALGWICKHRKKFDITGNDLKGNF